MQIAIVVLAAIVGVSSAGIIPYSGITVVEPGHPIPTTVIAGPTIVRAAPLSPALIHVPQSLVHVAPVQVAPAPVVLAAPAPVIQPGYVAATRGSVHVAPLPGHATIASHHLNLAPAPGTL